MAEERTWDPQNRRYVTRVTKTGADVANAQSTERMTNAAGLGSLQKKSARTPPKASDYGGDMKAYGEAMRRFRVDEEADPDSQARTRALNRMKKP